MPGDIQGLTNLAQTFNAIGDRHVGLGGDNQIQAGAGNWLGRAVNWIKSALHIGSTATINSAIMNHVVGRIRDTTGMGDHFANIARGRLGSALTRGMPITGREVSQVISDLVRQQGDEKQARESNIRLNVKGLCDAPSAGEDSESMLMDSMREKMTLFGMVGEMDTLTAQDYQGIQDKVEAQFVRQGASPSPQQAKEAVLEVCRQFSRDRIEGRIHDKVQIHCDHSGPDSALPTALRERAGLRGMALDLRPDQMGKLQDLVEKKLTVTCTYDRHNIHPPTDIEVQTQRTRSIDRFLDAMQVIEDNTTLGPEEKAVARDLVLSASSVFTPGMVGALCDALQSTQTLVATVNAPGTTPEQINEAMDTFQNAMTATFKPGGIQREGIEGMDEVDQVKDVLFEGAFRLEGLDGDTGKQALDGLLARGSAMNQHRFALARQNMATPAVMQKFIAGLQLLTGLAKHLDQPKSVSDRIMQGVGMDGVTFAQVRAHFGPGVHSDLGLTPVQGFDMEQATQFLEQELNKDMHAPGPEPGQGFMANASKTFQEKATHFSNDFLKDFFRNGITVNGETIKSTGTNDFPAMEQALDTLISKFPDAGEAGRVTAGLFQGTGASLFKALMQDPATQQDFMATISSPGRMLSDSLTFAITPQGEGKYHISVEMALQHSNRSPEGRADPRGMVSHLDLSVTGANLPGTVPQVTVDSFDFFLGTTDH